jgi:hypothetical protein
VGVETKPLSIVISVDSSTSLFLFLMISWNGPELRKLEKRDVKPKRLFAVVGAAVVVVLSGATVVEGMPPVVDVKVVLGVLVDSVSILSWIIEDVVEVLVLILDVSSIVVKVVLGSTVVVDVSSMAAGVLVLPAAERANSWIYKNLIKYLNLLCTRESPTQRK